MDEFLFFFSFFCFTFVCLFVKPENILVDNSQCVFPLVKLTDFSLAKICQNSIQLAPTVDGYYPYVDKSRQLGNGQIAFDPGTDCWAFAVVTYACLAGFFPHLTPNGSDISEEAMLMLQPDQTSESLRCLLASIFTRKLQRRSHSRKCIASHSWFTNNLQYEKSDQVDAKSGDNFSAYILWSDLKVLQHRLGISDEHNCWLQTLAIDAQIQSFIWKNGIATDNWQQVGCANCCQLCSFQQVPNE